MSRPLMNLDQPIQSEVLHDEEEDKDSLADLPSDKPQRNSHASSTSASIAAQKRDHSRKHSRIHSRNLSVFFPQPGSEAEKEADIILAHDSLTCRPTIELDTQLVDREILVQSRDEREFDQVCSEPSSTAPSDCNLSPTKSRKGHHRRHSVAHTHGDVSPPSRAGLQDQQECRTAMRGGSIHLDCDQTGAPAVHTGNPAVIIFGLCEFLIGSFMWWKGQTGDSLATAGMGYLTVFDAFVILGTSAVPFVLKKRYKKRRHGYPGKDVKLDYGEMRIETLLQFTQTIYLLFAAIYVCKESVEHALLEGSINDHEEDDIGLHLPLVVLLLSAAGTTFSNFFLDNHAQLVAAGKLSTLASESAPSRRAASLRNRHGRSASILADPTVVAGPFLKLLTNPFSVTVLFFNYTLALCALTLHPLQVAALDKVLAGLQSVAMLYVAFPASKALGRILLQTAPLPHDVQNVQLMRSIRTIEEHPLIVYVLPPKLWQLTPPTIAQSANTTATSNITALTSSHDFTARTSKSAVLVALVEILVNDKATDSEILDLTRWAWQLLSPSVGAAAGLPVGESMRGALRAGEMTVQILRQRDHDHSREGRKFPGQESHQHQDLKHH